MNAQTILNIIVWSYVICGALFFFGRWVYMKIKTHIEVKKSMKVEVKEEEEDVWKE